MNEPIKQHTITESYLKGFSKEGRVYYYDKLDPFRKIKDNSTSVVTVVPDFYTIIRPDGTKDYRVEKFLASQVEQDISLIISEIDKDFRSLSNPDLSNRLLDFLSFLPVRTTLFKERSKTITPKLLSARQSYVDHGVEQVISSLSKKGIGIGNKNALIKDFENIVDDWTEESKDENYFLKAMFRQQQKWKEVISQKDWHIMRTPKERPLLISDHVFNFQSSPYDESVFDDIIPIPLNLNLALVLGKKGNNHFENFVDNPNTVREINRSATQRFHRYIISHSDRLLLRNLENIKIDTSKF